MGYIMNYFIHICPVFLNSCYYGVNVFSIVSNNCLLNFECCGKYSLISMLFLLISATGQCNNLLWREIVKHPLPPGRLKAIITSSSSYVSFYFSFLVHPQFINNWLSWEWNCKMFLLRAYNRRLVFNHCQQILRNVLRWVFVQKLFMTLCYNVITWTIMLVEQRRCHTRAFHSFRKNICERCSY